MQIKDGAKYLYNHICCALRIRRYCDTSNKKKVTASKECLELWKTDGGRSLVQICYKNILAIHPISV